MWKQYQGRSTRESQATYSKLRTKISIMSAMIDKGSTSGDTDHEKTTDRGPGNCDKRIPQRPFFDRTGCDGMIKLVATKEMKLTPVQRGAEMGGNDPAPLRNRLKGNRRTRGSRCLVCKERDSYLEAERGQNKLKRFRELP